MSEAGQLMMWGLGWISAIPDGDSVLQLPVQQEHRHVERRAVAPRRVRQALRAGAARCPTGPSATALFRKMTELIVAYAPWIMASYRYYNVLAQPWLKAYKANPFLRSQWAYYDVDGATRP